MFNGREKVEKISIIHLLTYPLSNGQNSPDHRN